MPAVFRWMLVAVMAITICAGPSVAQVPDSVVAQAAQNPGDLKAQMDLGTAYYEADFLEGAARAFRQALAIDSSSVPALVNLGVTLNDLGQAQEAVIYLERAVALRADDATARTNLAIAYHSLGETERSVGLLRQALEQDPDHQLAHFQLGVAFAEARLFEEAVTEWQAVVAAGPQTAEGQQAQENLQRVEAIFAAERQRQDAIRSRR